MVSSDISEAMDMQTWRNELWLLKLWHPLYGQGSQKRSVLDDALAELATTRAQLAAMREKLALLDPVLRKLWAAHGSAEGAERYQEIEREWAYAMELMDEMLPVEWVVEGEGQDGEY